MPGVIVVGGGLAGWAAALAAAEEGARVTLLEKTGEVGGSTVLSGGFIALAGTAKQRELGIEDSPELLEHDLLEVGARLNDPALVRAYARGQGDLAVWLEDRGAAFEDVELSSGQSVARSHRTDPTRLVEALRDLAIEAGVDFRPGLAATELLREADGITGVLTEGERWDGAVVLASGGFSRSEELLSEYAPDQARALRIGGRGNTGDGLTMALEAGAGARDFEHIKGTFGTHPTTGVDKHEISLAYYGGAIIVDTSGERFVDESTSYKLIGDACLALDEPLAFQIFDERIFQSLPAGVPLFDQRPLLERELLLTAPSLDELARAIEIEPEALALTVRAYNDAIGAGDDPFGRTHLVAGAGDLTPIIEPPFFAFPSTTALLATYCGLTIDADAKVLDGDGAPIPGLWAAGEITGGFHGAAYMTGSSLGKAAYFGRAAGRDAAHHATTTEGQAQR